MAGISSREELGGLLGYLVDPSSYRLPDWMRSVRLGTRDVFKSSMAAHQEFIETHGPYAEKVRKSRKFEKEKLRWQMQFGRGNSAARNQPGQTILGKKFEIQFQYWAGGCTMRKDCRGRIKRSIRIQPRLEKQIALYDSHIGLPRSTSA